MHILLLLESEFVIGNGVLETYLLKKITNKSDMRSTLHSGVMNFTIKALVMLVSNKPTTYTQEYKPTQT